MINYKVRLIDTNGYKGIESCLNKEYDAELVMGQYWINNDQLKSKALFEGLNIVFDKSAVEVLEIRTERDTEGR